MDGPEFSRCAYDTMSYRFELAPVAGRSTAVKDADGGDYETRPFVYVRKLVHATSRYTRETSIESTKKIFYEDPSKLLKLVFILHGIGAIDEIRDKSASFRRSETNSTTNNT